MRSRLCGLLVALPLLISPATAGEDFKLEPGFTLLFNGKNLDGWKTKTGNESLEGKTEAYKGRFKVVSGVLVIDPSVKGDVTINTAAELKDAHIKFEFKPGANCNNDLFLRGMKFDIVPKALKSVKDGWNELEIIAKDGKAEVKVNGVTARMQDLKAPASPFGIRAEFGALEIRHLRAKQ